MDVKSVINCILGHIRHSTAWIGGLNLRFQTRVSQQRPFWRELLVRIVKQRTPCKAFTGGSVCCNKLFTPSSRFLHLRYYMLLLLYIWARSRDEEGPGVNQDFEMLQTTVTCFDSGSSVSTLRLESSDNNICFHQILMSFSSQDSQGLSAES